MATVLKRQRSLTRAFTTRAAGGVLLVTVGMLSILVLTRFALLAGLCIIAGAALIRSGYQFHRGAVGEGQVAKILSRFPDDWFVVHDLVVNGAQIDHLLVCPRGVYTLETKNLRGTIYGNAEKPRWSQVIKQRKRSFYSPVKQARGHSAALRSFLVANGFKSVEVNSIVVFTHPEVQLKVVSATVPVLYLTELRDYLHKQEEVLEHEACRAIAACLSELIPAEGGT